MLHIEQYWPEKIQKSKEIIAIENENFIEIQSVLQLLIEHVH